jgi:hypothetical protein
MYTYFTRITVERRIIVRTIVYSIYAAKTNFAWTTVVKTNVAINSQSSIGQMPPDKMLRKQMSLQ